MKLGGALTGYKRGLGDDAPETQVAEKRFDGVYDFLSLAKLCYNRPKECFTGETGGSSGPGVAASLKALAKAGATS